MKCPQCEVLELTMAERASVEIDYCPACRGVWLDRGELDKIIERSTAPVPVSTTNERMPESKAKQRFDDDDDKYRVRGHGKKKKGSLLSCLISKE